MIRVPISFMKFRFLVICFFLFLSATANAGTYYVRTDGNDSNSGLTNSATGSWKSISRCARSIVAGDVCRVQSGIYAEVVSINTSGYSNSYITYIADGPVTNHGWLITGNYVRVIAFLVEGNGIRNDGIYLQNANYVEIWHNTVQNFMRDAIRTDNGGRAYKSNNCLFIGNTIKYSRYKDFQVRGNSNIIAYNTAISPQTDFLYLFGQNNRVLNNHSTDINASSSSHTDFLQSGSDSVLGMGNSLIEANFYRDASNPSTIEHHHGSNVQNNSSSLDNNNVLRNNIWLNHGSYTYGFSGSYLNYLKIYNDTAVYAQQYTGHASTNTGTYNQGAYQSYKNNIFVQQWGSAVSTAVFYSNTNTGHDSDYNIWYDTGGNISYGSTIRNELNSKRNTNPLFVDTAQSLFNLQSNSPARNAGGPLTFVISPSGSGSTFEVRDATYFRGDDSSLHQYGGNLVVGDTITVGSDVLTVLAINGNTITVASPFSWIQEDPVFYGSSTTPDMGALPHRAHYTLSGTWSKTNDTVEVFPNDADLVRWAIVYEDGIPRGVANSSPFRVEGIGNGNITVKLFHRYASAEPIVEATNTGEQFPMPHNLRIINP